jgi:hypothetical protein
MKFKLQSKLWLIFFLIAAAMFTLFNPKAVRDFFFGIDPNERVTRTLEWKTTVGEERRAVFNIPRGYYAPADHNREGETIVLDVMYPGKTFVSKESGKPVNPSSVTILVQKGGSTLGDALKEAIDKNTLSGNRFFRKVVQKQGNFFTLEKTYKNSKPQERSDTSFLFFDATRGHWVESQLQYTTMQIGEGILKDQAASVDYHYREALEPDPIAMYQWVMTFVESLQVKQQATKAKQP